MLGETPDELYCNVCADEAFKALLEEEERKKAEEKLRQEEQGDAKRNRQKQKQQRKKERNKSKSETVVDPIAEPSKSADRKKEAGKQQTIDSPSQSSESANTTAGASQLPESSAVESKQEKKKASLLPSAELITSDPQAPADETWIIARICWGWGSADHL